jgi:hypothetical protein
MGTGKMYRCKDFGYEWLQLKGVGMLDVKAEKPKRKKWLNDFGNVFLVKYGKLRKYRSE